MCEALDKIKEIGVKKGILIGREEGRQDTGCRSGWRFSVQAKRYFSKRKKYRKDS